MIPLLDPEHHRAHRQRNMLHSVLLLLGIGAIVSLASLMLWGPTGVLVTLFMLLGLFLVSPRIPPEAVMKLYGAEEMPPERAGPLGRILDELTRRAELPRRPALYIVPSGTLNAFATGTRDNAAIAVTEGLIRRLTLREIAGVLAHETSHILNNDLRVMGLADMLTRFAQTLSYVAVTLAIINLFAILAGDPALSWWPILLLYLTPLLTSLLQLALSRTREFDADIEGASLTGDPVGLASALRRLDRYTGQFWEDMMMPVPSRRIPQPSVLRSHPETEERVKRLLSLAPTNRAPLSIPEEPMVSMVGWGPGTMRPRYRWPGVWY